MKVGKAFSHEEKLFQTQSNVYVHTHTVTAPGAHLYKRLALDKQRHKYKTACC